MMFIYDRAKASLEIFSPERISQRPSQMTTIRIEEIVKAQPKWIGLEILEGHIPEVDFAYDQMLMELKLADQYNRAPEAFPATVNSLFERFKTRLHPPVLEQKRRLERMSEFFIAIQNVDPATDTILVDPNLQILQGRAILARALLDGSNEVTVQQVTEMPYPDRKIELTVWLDHTEMDVLSYD